MPTPSLSISFSTDENGRLHPEGVVACHSSVEMTPDPENRGYLTFSCEGEAFIDSSDVTGFPEIYWGKFVETKASATTRFLSQACPKNHRGNESVPMVNYDVTNADKIHVKSCVEIEAACVGEVNTDVDQTGTTITYNSYEGEFLTNSMAYPGAKILSVNNRVDSYWVCHYQPDQNIEENILAGACQSFLPEPDTRTCDAIVESQAFSECLDSLE